MVGPRYGDDASEGTKGRPLVVSLGSERFDRDATAPIRTGRETWPPGGARSRPLSRGWIPRLLHHRGGDVPHGPRRTRTVGQHPRADSESSVGETGTARRRGEILRDGGRRAKRSEAENHSGRDLS